MTNKGLIHFQSLFNIGFNIKDSEEIFDIRVNRIFNDLLHRYTEPHRYYHTIDHIEALGRWYCEWRGTTKQAPSREMCLAILYHDAVYNTEITNHTYNEALSAELFNAHADSMGIELHLADVVEDLILTTKSGAVNHSRLTDLDLCILATSLPQYRQYAMGIRREWKHFPDSVYLPERLKFLNRLLDKSNTTGIYKDEVFKSYNDHAKENLKKEIQVLNDTGTPFGDWINTSTTTIVTL